MTEDVPMNAYFLEVVCKLIYVEAAASHANLSDLERDNLVNRFNNPEDTLTVLIIMYQALSQGVSLDSCCCRVVVATLAPNALFEIQAWSRVLRVIRVRNEIPPTRNNLLTLCHLYRYHKRMPCL